MLRRRPPPPAVRRDGSPGPWCRWRAPRGTGPGRRFRRPAPAPGWCRGWRRGVAAVGRDEDRAEAAATRGEGSAEVMADEHGLPREAVRGNVGGVAVVHLPRHQVVAPAGRGGRRSARPRWRRCWRVPAGPGGLGDGAGIHSGDQARVRVHLDGGRRRAGQEPQAQQRQAHTRGHWKYPYTSSTRCTVPEEPAGMSHFTHTRPSGPRSTMAPLARVRPGAKLRRLASGCGWPAG